MSEDETTKAFAEAQRRLAAWTPDASRCDKEPTGIGRERTRSGTAEGCTPPRTTWVAVSCSTLPVCPPIASRCIRTASRHPFPCNSRW